MTQQQKQLPQTQTEDWQVRLAERMASQEWKDSDPIFASLTQQEALTFLFTQNQVDYRQRQYRRNLYIVSILVSLLGFIVCVVLDITASIWLSVFGTFLSLHYMAFPAKQDARIHHTGRQLEKLLVVCRDAVLIPSLIQHRSQLRVKHRVLVDGALTRILTTMSGDDVFAILFELRVELAQFAERTRPIDSPRTPESLAIVILLALTSARDGNIQPVLRRLSKNARSLRLREVAAECLREFSAAP